LTQGWLRNGPQSTLYSALKKVILKFIQNYRSDYLFLLNFIKILFKRLETGKFHKKNISDPGLAQGLYAKYYMAMYLKKTSKLRNYHLNRLKNFEFVETNVFTQNRLENRLKFSFLNNFEIFIEIPCLNNEYYFDP
jgi:hypothetical protein